LTGNSIGISILSQHTTVKNNVLTFNNYDGIDMGGNYSEITNNIIESNGYYGVFVQQSTGNTFRGNFIINHTSSGIDAHSTTGNTFYDNFFNNTDNAEVDESNTWNTTKTAGPNIIGGSYLGGNYWATPTGDGWSQTCTDANNDGICDTVYVFGTGDIGIDNLPLTNNTAPVTPAPVANFTANVTSGTAPLAVQFTDTSASPGITSWKWDFDHNGVTDSTAQNPVYSYSIPGNYTVNFTVTNSSGSGSLVKPDYINVTTPSIDVNVTGSIPNWNFNNGLNENTTAVQLTIDTNMNQWSVRAKDALDGGKPPGTAGKMAEWTGSAYIPDGEFLSNPIQVKYGIGTGTYITLSGTDQVLTSGTSTGMYSDYLGINQQVEPTDPALSGSNYYHILVTVTGYTA
jgi:PKD repeat protein